MNQRLVRILASVIGTTGDYALARLELGVKYPSLALPPVLPRLADASEESLRRQWPDLEARLEAAMRWLKQTDAGGRSSLRSDPALAWMRRTIRELDQYARALRWVLTVTERNLDEPE